MKLSSVGVLQVNPRVFGLIHRKTVQRNDYVTKWIIGSESVFVLQSEW